MLKPIFPEALQDGRIDGRAIASRVRGRVSEEVDKLDERGISLTLAVVRVGGDKASEIYVNHKVKACAEVGIESRHIHVPETISEESLIKHVAELNGNDDIDGILVQLPLPEHIDSSAVIDAVSPLKDADGFHPHNLGQLFSRFALLEPCTPMGIMTMLKAIGCEVKGKHAVVVGRSVIVGRPVSDMLLRAHATLTACHRHTQDLKSHVERADVLVVAAGVEGLVPGEWIKEGAVVVDVGMNRSSDGKLCGDVGYEEALKRAAAITPVPGGVGPMTVAMLLWNTLLAATRRHDGLEAAHKLRCSLMDSEVEEGT